MVGFVLHWVFSPKAPGNMLRKYPIKARERAISSKRLEHSQGGEASRNCITSGFVKPPLARLSMLQACCASTLGSLQCPCRQGQVSFYTGLCYSTKIGAYPEPIDTKQTNCLASSLRQHSVPFPPLGFFPSILGVGVQLYLMTACWHMASSFLTVRLGLPRASTVCLHAPTPPS